MEFKGKATIRLSGKVQKIIPSRDPAVPDRVEISFEGAEDLYREIRINNCFLDGRALGLEEGDQVQLLIEVGPGSSADAPREKFQANE